MEEKRRESWKEERISDEFDRQKAVYVLPWYSPHFRIIPYEHFELVCILLRQCL